MQFLFAEGQGAESKYGHETRSGFSFLIECPLMGQVSQGHRNGFTHRECYGVGGSGAKDSGFFYEKGMGI
jgi:hypothetical protein